MFFYGIAVETSCYFLILLLCWAQFDAHGCVLERRYKFWLHRLLHRGQIDPHWFLCSLPEINTLKNSKEPDNKNIKPL